MNFEQGFLDAERAALAVERAAKDAAKVAKQMEKAAQDGDIRKLRRAAASVAAAADTVKQEAANARAAWPFSEDQEQEHLERGYAGEFLSVARDIGLTVHERDDRLVAFPSILQILPAERAIKIDRKKTSSLRPSRLAHLLLDNQKKGPRSRSEHFLESLYAAYKMLVRKEDAGIAIKLSNVYDAFTLQPGAGSEYGKSEFARDVFMLDRSGLTKTRSGAAVSLPASTSAKGAERDRIPFVAPDGERVTYYGLQFTEAKA